MQKEIGSVLEFAAYDSYPYPATDGNTFTMPFMNGHPDNYKTYFFQNARNAIEALAISLKHETPDLTVYLPDYVCDTVPDAFARANVKIETYHINRQLETDPEQLLALGARSSTQKNQSLAQTNAKSVCLFICHFFGKPIQNDILRAVSVLREQGIKVIEDLTMSLYSAEEDNVGFGDYMIGSIRKWLPIPDGGFLTVKQSTGLELPPLQEPGQYTYLYTIVQSMKREYVTGRYADTALKNTYMQYYKDAVRLLFSDYTIREISQLSKNYILTQDHPGSSAKRCENYDRLYQELSASAILHPVTQREGNYVPFMFTALCDCRDHLLEYLISEDIYCNIHWKLKNASDPDTRYLCDHMISIPCDQRYGADDMTHIAQKIKTFEKQRTGK